MSWLRFNQITNPFASRAFDQPSKNWTKWKLELSRRDGPGVREGAIPKKAHMEEHSVAVFATGSGGGELADICRKVWICKTCGSCKKRIAI